MNESTTPTTKQFTSCASLAAIGIKLRELKLFQPIEKTVQIAQKTIKDSPTQKLYDALISILAGAHGLIEINTRLRADAALQRAFGRSRCAEQSVVQDTLNASTAENVEQMQQAMDRIYRQHSQGYQHDSPASRPNVWPRACRTGTSILISPSASSAGSRRRPRLMCVPSSASPCAAANRTASSRTACCFPLCRPSTSSL